jgi:hypothetical protein
MRKPDYSERSVKCKNSRTANDETDAVIDEGMLKFLGLGSQGHIDPDDASKFATTVYILST